LEGVATGDGLSRCDTPKLTEGVMALRITIDIFSGRPNPSFVLSDRETQAALERLAPAPKSDRKRLAPPPQSLLGYRGILVEQEGRTLKGIPKSFRVAGGRLIEGKTARPIAGEDFEDFVCGSTGPKRLRLGLDLPELCVRELKRFRKLMLVYPWPPFKWPPVIPSCYCAPLYEPSWWNDGGQKQWNNNCYNYATNYRSDTFAQPGRAAGAMYTALSCSSVKPAAIADALLDGSSIGNRCPTKGHMVALVIWPGVDFHWYRKGKNGYWSHKPGGTQATNLDNSGAVIPDPQTADRGGYTSFCSYMVVMHGHIKLN
jgi:hypothetical protein